MKKLILGAILFFGVVSCNLSTFKNNDELFSKTDSFVSNLQTNYNSYGLLGGMEFKETTSDNVYQIMPIGRLINVKILDHEKGGDYPQLMEDLKQHYEGKPNVNDVYICAGGTVMIDCRN